MNNSVTHLNFFFPNRLWKIFALLSENICNWKIFTLLHLTFCIDWKEFSAVLIERKFARRSCNMEDHRRVNDLSQLFMTKLLFWSSLQQLQPKSISPNRHAWYSPATKNDTKTTRHHRKMKSSSLISPTLKLVVSVFVSYAVRFVFIMAFIV